MTIQHCTYCGGTHFGSIRCPYLCEVCNGDTRQDTQGSPPCVCPVVCERGCRGKCNGHLSQELRERVPKYVLRLNGSQRMAVASLISDYMRHPHHTQEFVDVSTDIRTTPGDLLRLLVDSINEIEL